MSTKKVQREATTQIYLKQRAGVVGPFALSSSSILSDFESYLKTGSPTYGRYVSFVNGIPATIVVDFREVQSISSGN